MSRNVDHSDVVTSKKLRSTDDNLKIECFIYFSCLGLASHYVLQCDHDTSEMFFFFQFCSAIGILNDGFFRSCLVLILGAFSFTTVGVYILVTVSESRISRIFLTRTEIIFIAAG